MAKFYKKKKHFDVDKVRAYWMGVGMSQCIHDKRDPGQAGGKFKDSMIKGYESDNSQDVGKKFFK